MGCGLQSSSTSFLSVVTPSAGVDLLGWSRVGVLDGEQLSWAECPLHLQGDAWWSRGEGELYQSYSGDRQERIHAVALGREQESPPPAG